MSVFSRALLLFLFFASCLTRYSNCVYLLPKGPVSSQIEDENFKKVPLTKSLQFFERQYDTIYLSDDGVIVFDPDMRGTTNKPQKFPYEKSMIAPMWHDFDGARIYYREIKKEKKDDKLDLMTTSNLVRMTHPDDFSTFEANWAMVITWYNVTRFNDQFERSHTFQAVLASDDSNSTFAIFLYDDVQNGDNAQVGVNAGHCDIYYSLCISLTKETGNLKNVRPCDGDFGIVGFRIDTADRDESFYLCTPTYTNDPSSQCECSSLDLPTGEIVSEHNRTRVGDVVTYTCQPDYVMVGDDEVACWYNGTAALWDGYEHSCKKRPVWQSPTQGDYDTVDIPENMMPDSAIYNLEATAGDGSANITYSFIKQTPSTPMLFDLFDNQVKVAPDADLDIDDKDTPTTFVLHFSANDTRYPYSSGKVSADTFLVVIITDVNDNSPRFTQARYSATIEGDQKLDSKVLEVTATDNDLSSPNNVVRYEFIDQDHPGYFSLGPWDGVLKLIKIPAFPTYKMSIKVSDGSPPHRMDATKVTIFVNSVMTTTKATPTNAAESNSATAQPSGSSSWTIAGIVIGVIVVGVVALILVFVYRRRCMLGKLNLSATFKAANANVSLENHTGVINSNYIDDNRPPVNRNSTNECQPGTVHDTHYDTDVLTTESWQKEKERVKF